MSNYIPNGDAAFQAWLNTFVEVASANATALGLSTTQLASITSSQSGFTTAYSTHLFNTNVARSSTAAKDAQRKATEGLIRATVNQIQALPTLTDALRRELGINVRKPRVKHMPVTPENLGALISATATAVSLTWKPAGNAYPTDYFVEKKVGAGPWMTLLYTTRRRATVEIDSTQPTQFRVYASRDGAQSAPCSPVTVFNGLVTQSADLQLAA